MRMILFLATLAGSAKASAPRRGARLGLGSPSRASLDGLLNLLLHGIEVEARALLHGRILDGRLGQLRHLLLDEHEPPELVLEPTEVTLRAVEGTVLRPAQALERVQAQVRDRRHVQ